MEIDLIQIRVRIPESSIGNVSGELSSRGAWLDELKSERGVSIISARLPQAELTDFESWLNLFTRGVGRVETEAKR